MFGVGTNPRQIVRSYLDFHQTGPNPSGSNTRDSRVGPNHDVWIGKLVALELAVGAPSLAGTRRTEPGYGIVIAFHLCLFSFRWGSTSS